MEGSVAILALATGYITTVLVVAWVVVRTMPYIVPVLRFVQTARPADLTRAERASAAGAALPASAVDGVSQERIDDALRRVADMQARAREIEAMADGRDKDARNVSLGWLLESVAPDIALLKRVGRLPRESA